MGLYTETDSEFARAVFLLLAAVPTGQVISYGELARHAGYRGHARQVGRLMKQLPPDTRLPWHRVIRSDGRIVAGQEQVSRLLSEGIVVRHGRVEKTGSS